MKKLLLALLSCLLMGSASAATYQNYYVTNANPAISTAGTNAVLGLMSTNKIPATNIYIGGQILSGAMGTNTGVGKVLEDHGTYAGWMVPTNLSGVGATNVYQTDFGAGLTATTNLFLYTVSAVAQTNQVFVNNTGLPGVVVGNAIGTNVSTFLTSQTNQVFINNTGLPGVVAGNAIGTNVSTFLTSQTNQVFVNNTGLPGVISTNGIGTNMSATYLTGTLPDARLSTNVVVRSNNFVPITLGGIPVAASTTRLITNSLWAGSLDYVEIINEFMFNNSGVRASYFVGDGNYVTNLNATKIIGIVSPTNLGLFATLNVGGRYLRNDGTFQILTPGSGDMMYSENLASMANFGTSRSNLLAHEGSNITIGVISAARFATNAPTSNYVLKASSAATATWVDIGTVSSLLIANNLSDVANTNTALTNLNAHNASRLTIGQVSTALLASNTPANTLVLRATSANSAAWSPGGGDVVAANNLTDLASLSEARTNLGANDAANLTVGILPDARLSTNVITVGRLDFVNGTNYGMSTTSADNSVSLSNALWYATQTGRPGRVYIPAGTYYFSATVHPPLRTDIYGAGSTTILIQTNDVDLLHYSNGAECYLHDMVLRGVDATMTTGCGVVVDSMVAGNFSGEFIKLDRLFITYFAHALKLYNTALVSVKDCGFHFQSLGPILIHTNDTLIVEQCGMGYGTNVSQQGSAPIFDIKGNFKSIKISSCEIGNFHPFVVMDTNTSSFDIEVDGCNFERASYQKAGLGTNLVVLRGGGSFRFLGNRYNGGDNSYTNGLIRGIGTPTYPRTITFDSPNEDLPSVSGTYPLLYSDDWTGRGQFVGMSPGVWRAGGVLKTNSVLFDGDVASGSFNPTNATLYGSTILTGNSAVTALISNSANSMVLDMFSGYSGAGFDGGVVIQQRTTNTVPLALKIGVTGSATAANRGYWLQAAETGVSDDRHLGLQRYGGTVDIGLAATPAVLTVTGTNIIASAGSKLNGVGFTNGNAYVFGVLLATNGPWVISNADNTISGSNYFSGPNYFSGSNYFTGTEYMAGAVRMADGSLLATNMTTRTNASGGTALTVYGNVVVNGTNFGSGAGLTDVIASNTNSFANTNDSRAMTWSSSQNKINLTSATGLPVTGITASGSPNAGNYLSGAGVWSIPGSTGGALNGTNNWTGTNTFVTAPVIISNLTVTGALGINNAYFTNGYFGYTNSVAGFDVNGKLIATNITGVTGMLTNQFTTNIVGAAINGGVTFNSPVLTTSSSSNSPAATELASAGWVRGLFDSAGASYYATTNVTSFVTNTSWATTNTTIFAFNTAQPTTYNTRVYVAPEAASYLAGSSTTNKFQQLNAGATVNAMLTASGSGLSIKPEIYISYTGTNDWFGDWSGAYQTISSASTNLYSWVVANPSYTSTNAAGFYVLGTFKIGVQNTPARNLTFHIGTNAVVADASHISVSGSSLGSGNAYLAANQTWTGSNIFNGGMSGNGSGLTSLTGAYVVTNSAGILAITAGQTNTTQLATDLQITARTNAASILAITAQQTNTTQLLTDLQITARTNASSIITIASPLTNATGILAITAGQTIQSTNIVNAFKAPFSTNYPVVLSDSIICSTGTNQLITLPNITNGVPNGKMFTILISSTTGYGSAIVTNANGVQTILKAAALSQTITNGQSLTVISDGGNWR